ncbi:MULTISPECIES: bifunctional oligoribonuclease/PAP phosphatase NrnA [unclassified Adlercreutzia]|uniref:DHH family phosphoesterase n=1 Tax=unclassified Adlercreutzia TaxID=2636013 RepID=UPI0013EC270E|nr:MULTISPECIES: DHH family phosphoesterase [unclassified Adlercreutzia]
MSVTPQTNATLPAIAEALTQYDDVLICGHVNPDGDCLGSQLALAHALHALGKRVTCLLATDEPVGASLRFLPGVADMTPASAFADERAVSRAVFVAVDVPTPERLGPAAAALHAAAVLTVTVDHHAVPERMSDLSYTDPDAASTSMLVWELAEHLLGAEGRARLPQLATCAYTGLVTDTGRFQFQNADHACFAAAAQMVAAGAEPADVARQVYQSRTLASVQLEGIAVSRMRLLREGRVAVSWITQEDMVRLGAVKADAEPLVDVLRSIGSVRVACMLRDQGSEVRGSFRAKDDTDVAAIAREFGGGGHKAAAGFTLPAGIEGALDAIARRLEAVSFREATA